jgi:hypothetical protein
MANRLTANTVAHQFGQMTYARFINRSLEIARRAGRP